MDASHGRISSILLSKVYADMFYGCSCFCCLSKVYILSCCKSGEISTKRDDMLGCRVAVKGPPAGRVVGLVLFKYLD